MFPSRRSLYQCESKCQLCTIGTFPFLFANSFCFIYSSYSHFCFLLSYLFIFFAEVQCPVRLVCEKPVLLISSLFCNLDFSILFFILAKSD